MYRNLKHIDQCLVSASPSLGAIRREIGVEFSEAFLQAWLININEILNLNKPMTESQIAICTSEIINSYPSLKIADLTLLCKRILAGEFGEFYESLSTPKVLTFFRNYNEDRMNLAYEKNLRDHLDLKAGDPLNVSNNVKRNWKS